MRIYMYWYMAWQSQSHTLFWAFPDLSEDKRSRRNGKPPWETRWNTLQTWPATCKHGSGSPTAANQPNENEETSNPRFRKFKHWSQIDGWMIGWSVGDRLDIASRPDGSTDRQTRLQTNQPASQTPAINPTKRPIPANKPTIRPACYKSNHRQSIYPTDRKPTSQTVLTSDHCLNFRYWDSMYPYFHLAGCTAAVYLQGWPEKMSPDKMSRRKCRGQNVMWTKFHWTKCRGQNAVDNMLWTKCRGQNDSTFWPITFCPHNILSATLCPWHFVRWHFVLEPLHNIHATCERIPCFSVWSAVLYLTFIWTPFSITQFLRWGVWPILAMIRIS